MSLVPMSTHPSFYPRADPLGIPAIRPMVDFSGRGVGNAMTPLPPLDLPTPVMGMHKNETPRFVPSGGLPENAPAVWRSSAPALMQPPVWGGNAPALMQPALMQPPVWGGNAPALMQPALMQPLGLPENAPALIQPARGAPRQCPRCLEEQRPRSLSCSPWGSRRMPPL
ncbi:hypothetical protein GUITHDRAFT_121656 [Guillardia theta CCMP2712]|uniref:Uncharacterized protein n=1 Tax=Guillardia theta (strain CCMP2712) TaxID=905079 RepID=L1I7T8_GUITC|nr:hypothetical protein GUITHDRAFT_121656 [Guillardia theta CCMP2712]EKX32162.1 hypothetical protein GUITHDRAFT_121656 [Guillardia theta CCMP2712]|eukprot:XP_005819142.1 hypothetical protein GUITHDRAFT_121656 [Guillardia theta CCMP2712]